MNTNANPSTPRKRRLRADRMPPPNSEIEVIEDLVPVTDLANDPAVIELTEWVRRAAADRRKAVSP